MQFLLLFSLTSLLSLFHFDGWRGDIEQPQAQQEALCLDPTVAIKVILEGAYISPVAGSNVKMTTSLRTRLAAIANNIYNSGNMTEPYTATTTINTGTVSMPILNTYTLGVTAYGGGGGNFASSAVFLGTFNGNYNTGDNAIVDWVFIQLRNATTPTTIVATQSALLQADGDVVDVDGQSPVTFKRTTYTALDCGNSFHVAILHRNHLGIRTLNPLTLSNVATTIDFTNPLEPVLGTNARKTLSNGTLVMYSGDADRDGRVNANDYNLWYAQLAVSYNYFTQTADFNLSGNNVVNALDYNLWYANANRSAQSTAKF
jgi:hypothetical protein